MLGLDSLKVGDLLVNNASLGLVTKASVNLTGASCDGIFVSDLPLPSVPHSICVLWVVCLGSFALNAADQKFVFLQGLARPGLARSGRPAFYKMLSEKVSAQVIG